MGSNKKISFFSGTSSLPDAYDPNINTETVRSGAVVEIGPERILMGVSKLNGTVNTNTTAIDINSDEIILGAGLINNTDLDSSNSNSTYETLKISSSVSGIVISKNAIGMATGTSSGAIDTRNLILMDEDGIILGQAQGVINATAALSPDYTGSFVSLG